MKKTIISLIALAGVVSATDDATIWTFSTNGTYNGTEGASYAGFNFTLSGEMSSRVTTSASTQGVEITPLVGLDSISLTTRGNQDVVGTYNLYVVDSNGTLMAVSSNSVSLDTNNVATEMEFNFTVDSTYGTNKSLTLDTKYYAYLIDSTYLSTNWTSKVIGSTIAGDQINSIQLACYGYGNPNNQEEWGCAGLNRSVLYPNFAPIATVNVHSVPEPTTATLSLLALAGLAARRRRR